MSIGLAIVGAGYWGPNLVRTALATPAFQLLEAASRSVDSGGARISLP